MGRAIDMEKDLDVVKEEITTLRNSIKGCIFRIEQLTEKLDDLSESVLSLLGASSTTKNVDLDEEISKTEKEKNSAEEKTNNKGNGKGSKRGNKTSGDGKGKSVKSGSKSV